jgi:hypothetical protein
MNCTTPLFNILAPRSGFKKLPDDDRLLPKHVGASILNKGVVQSVHNVGCPLLHKHLRFSCIWGYHWQYKKFIVLFDVTPSFLVEEYWVSDEFFVSIFISHSYSIFSINPCITVCGPNTWIFSLYYGMCEWGSTLTNVTPPKSYKNFN